MNAIVLILASLVLILLLFVILKKRAQKRLLIELDALEECCSLFSSGPLFPPGSMEPTFWLIGDLRDKIQNGSFSRKKLEGQFKNIESILANIDNLLAEELKPLKTEDDFARAVHCLSDHTLHPALVGIINKVPRPSVRLMHIMKRAETAMEETKNPRSQTTWRKRYLRCAISRIELFHFKAFA